jgi:hypothetical protein
MKQHRAMHRFGDIAEVHTIGQGLVPPIPRRPIISLLVVHLRMDINASRATITSRVDISNVIRNPLDTPF